MKLKDILKETTNTNIISDWGWNARNIIKKRQITKAIENIENVIRDELYDKRFDITKDVSIVIYKNGTVAIITDLDIDTNDLTFDTLLVHLNKQLKEL